jgi:hippurate hydrolase
LFAQFPMDAIFGMHNWPGLAAGDFAICSGPIMASSNEFKITVTGKGSHAALPHNGIDPVPVACQMVQAFQTIITRNKKPLDAAVISVTMIHAGEATNVVPDHCEIQGTVRTFTLDVLDLIERRMRDIAQHTAAAFGATAQFEFHRNYPPTVNHRAEAEFVRDAMRAVAGEARVHEFEPTMGAEDFSFFLQAQPGAYFMIGNGDGDHRALGHGLGPCNLHNPNYDFNDGLIPQGAGLWVEMARRWLCRSA